MVYVECHLYSVLFMQTVINAFMLSVTIKPIMKNAVVTSVFVLSDIVTKILMLRVVATSVVRLCVKASFVMDVFARTDIYI